MKKLFFLTLLVMSIVSSCNSDSESNSKSVKTVIDDVVTRFYQDLSAEQLNTLGTSFILKNLSEEEKLVLSTKYWYFNVNTPVKVSLMRDKNQPEVPFWFLERGFTKTNMLVKNIHSSYEVWQKDFTSGKVELGINGFDMFRSVYFISVESLELETGLEISNIFPEWQHLDTLNVGSFTYHDWDELVLDEVPEELRGQVLFTTIRGRAREAHLVEAFRTTDYPSGLKPDQIMLTWSDNPATSIDIQWRTNTSIETGEVKYWLSGYSDTLISIADLKPMEDRLLQNDRYVNRFTARISDLQSGISYSYKVGSSSGVWSDIASFKTQDEVDDTFSFIWFGDTHKSKKWGDLLQVAGKKFPEAEFYSIAGDLVNTGLYRDDWDQLFAFSGSAFNYKPLMPVPGNHDKQDGLGAWMYQDMFSLPENGPEKILPELTYSFTYKNTLFLMLDVTSSMDLQSSWIEDQLKNSDATWKFAMFHFPPFNYEEDYPEIRRKWSVWFDKYHLDMVMSGHTHYYMRSKPINNDQIVEDFSQGTIYVISIGIPNNHVNMPPEDYAEVRDGKGWLYQHMEIKGNKLIYKSLDIEGNILDEFVIEK